MEFPIKTGAPATQKTACAILPIFAARGLKGATREIDRSCGGLLSQLVKSGDASGKLGETLLVPRLEGTAAGRALLLGCGKQADFDAKRFRQAVTAAVRKLRNTGLKEATSYLTYTRHRDLSPYYAGRISVEATHAALYQFEELKSQSAAKYKLAKLAIAIVDRQDAKEYRRHEGGEEHDRGEVLLDVCQFVLVAKVPPRFIEDRGQSKNGNGSQVAKANDTPMIEYERNACQAAREPHRRVPARFAV